MRVDANIVAFNTAEGWSRDVTVEIADELRRRYVEFGEYRSRSSTSWLTTGADVAALLWIRMPNLRRLCGLEKIPRYGDLFA